MDEQPHKQSLRDEGFSRVYVWEDRPNAKHSPHTHPVETAHIVLEGSIWMKVNGKEAWYSKGDRFDIPAETKHEAKAGPNGCRYIIGERS